MTWKDIGGLVIGAILGIAGTFFLFQGRVSTLEARIQFLLTPQYAQMTEEAQRVSTGVAATLTSAPTATPVWTPTPSAPTSTPDAAATSTAQAAAVGTRVAATLTALPVPPTVTPAVPTPTPTSLPTSTPTPMPDAVVSLYGAALWGEPTLGSLFDNVYLSGTPMKVLGKQVDGRVLLVEAPDGHVGWTLLEYLRLNTPLAAVRVICGSVTPTATSAATASAGPTATVSATP
jgi:hypothetical protein